MRGRGRPIATVLTDALAGRRDARLAAAAAAFSEACGWPLASTQGWAEQVERLASQLCQRVNARLGRAVAVGLEVRVGPLDR